MVRILVSGTYMDATLRGMRVESGDILSSLDWYENELVLHGLAEPISVADSDQDVDTSQPSPDQPEKPKEDGPRKAPKRTNPFL